MNKMVLIPIEKYQKLMGDKLEPVSKNIVSPMENPREKTPLEKIMPVPKMEKTLEPPLEKPVPNKPPGIPYTPEIKAPRKKPNSQSDFRKHLKKKWISL
jgi:hypothetical protein